MLPLSVFMQTLLSQSEASPGVDVGLPAVAHELRTPLNAVIGWARLLQTGTMSPAGRVKAADAILRSALVMSQLIDDLLDASRDASGGFRLVRQSVDLTLVSQHAVDAMLPVAAARGVRIAVSSAIADARIDGDPVRLEQLLLNLLTNAVKFTPPGGAVDVTLTGVGRYVELVVRDTGQGISPAFLPHVFDRFRQGGPDSEGSGLGTQGGLGLGLSIARDLARRHGGTIDVASAGEGRGTSVVVRLPRGPAEPVDGAATSAPLAAHASDANECASDVNA